jgi:hypothetical protein
VPNPDELCNTNENLQAAAHVEPELNRSSQFGLVQFPHRAGISTLETTRQQTAEQVSTVT